MNQPKKILFVITKANFGGAQKYVYDLALAAHDAGHEVAVAYGEDGELARRLKAAGIRTLPVAGLARDISLLRELAAYRALRALFMRERPDVVHLNSSKAGGTGALAARMARVPNIIFTAHGWAWNESRPWWQRDIVRKLAWLTALFAHKTICVSEAIRRDAHFMPFVQKKFVVIHNGIACGALLPREDARRKLAPHLRAETWVGMLSELHSTKRIEDALRAFKEISEDFPNAALVVLGEGAERAKLESLAHALGCAERVLLAGFVPDAPAYLSVFDFFVHASQSEALGYAILEAGCASLPVVATRVGGIPEIIEDGVSGILVPPHAPEKLADALRALISNPTRAAVLGAALHKKVLADFSKQKMLAATLAEYSNSNA